MQVTNRHLSEAMTHLLKRFGLWEHVATDDNSDFLITSCMSRDIFFSVDVTTINEVMTSKDPTDLLKPLIDSLTHSPYVKELVKEYTDKIDKLEKDIEELQPYKTYYDFHRRMNTPIHETETSDD